MRENRLLDLRKDKMLHKKLGFFGSYLKLSTEEKINIGDRELY